MFKQNWVVPVRSSSFLVLSSSPLPCPLSSSSGTLTTTWWVPLQTLFSHFPLSLHVHMPLILHKHHLVCLLSVSSQDDAIAYCTWKVSVYYTSIHSRICWSLLLGGNIVNQVLKEWESGILCYPTVLWSWYTGVRCVQQFLSSGMLFWPCCLFSALQMIQVWFRKNSSVFLRFGKTKKVFQWSMIFFFY